MDEETGKQRKKVTGDFVGAAPDAPKFSIRMSPERVSEYRAIVQKHIQDYKVDEQRFSKAAKTFWMDKSHVSLGRWLSEVEVFSSVNFWTIAFSLDYVETRLSNLESLVEGIAKRVNVDLSSLKAEVKRLHKTINEPMFTELNEYIQTMKATYNRRKEAGKEYVE